MPAVGAAIASVVGAVASAISSVVGVITAVVSSAIAPAVAAVGSVVGAIGSALAGTAGSIVKVVADTVTPFIDGIGKAISEITAGITKAAEPILSPVRDGLQFIFDKLKAVEDWIETAFHPSKELEALKSAHPDVWAISDGSNEVFRDLLVSRGIISSTKGSLLLLPDAIETINQVATLKVLADLTQGQASVAEVLGSVAKGSRTATATAIARLSKGIVSSTVGIMDRIDTEAGILRAEIDSFDERLSSELKNYAARTEAEVLGIVTPKLDVLGENQINVNRKIARLTRHIEDDVWFAWKLYQILTG